MLPWILNVLLSDDWDDNGMKTVIMMKKDTATTMTEKPKTKSTTDILYFLNIFPHTLKEISKRMIA